MAIKKIVVVIPWSINNDSRAKRTIYEMSKTARLMFFIFQIRMDKTISSNYNKNIRFHPLYTPKKTRYIK